jgi:hypothetical protein
MLSQSIESHYKNGHHVFWLCKIPTSDPTTNYVPSRNKELPEASWSPMIYVAPFFLWEMMNTPNALLEVILMQWKNVICSNRPLVHIYLW